VLEGVGRRRDMMLAYVVGVLELGEWNLFDGDLEGPSDMIVSPTLGLLLRQESSHS